MKLGSKWRVRLLSVVLMALATGCGKGNPFKSPDNPIVCTDCGPSPPIESGVIEQSQAAWAAVKDSKYRQGYRYTRFQGGFVESSTTTMVVKDDQVLSRAFCLNCRDARPGVRSVYYKEFRSTLRSHAEGAPPVTMEGLYDECKTLWASMDRSKFYFDFKTDENGVMKACTIRFITPVADDNSAGILLDDLRSLREAARP